MRIKLVSTDCFTPVLDLAIARLPSVIGCDHRVDFRLTDRGVGSRHCEFLVCEGALIVRTIKSHEILVNGELVSDAVLQSGDILTVGIRSLRITFGNKSNKKRQAAVQEENDLSPASGITSPPQKAAELTQNTNP